MNHPEETRPFRVVVHGLTNFCKRLPPLLRSADWEIQFHDVDTASSLAALANELRRSDLVYTWGGRITLGKFLWAARALRKSKLIMFWCGSDVLFAQEQFAQGKLEPWVADKVHWAGAPWLAEEVRAMGLRCDVVSVGSTPTLHYARNLEGVSEARAGVYAFGDLVQAELGTCAMEDIAIGVMASVIGHNRHHGRVLIDAGFLALSRDRSTADLPYDWGYGAVCDPVSSEVLEDLTVSSTNQEHGMITSRSSEIDFDRLPIGARVRILPNHACATAAAYERYFVTDGGERIVDCWERVNGW